MTLTTDLRATPRFEWPTWALLVLSYATWAYATAGSLPIWAAICAVAFAAALHSSLSHEALHGHPTPWAGVNEALVTPALTFCVPYRRFRDTHLAHHHDERLTDPYDDPETNFLDPEVWARLPKAWQLVLQFNNTLFGRLLLGPALGIGAFLLGDFRLIRAGNREVRAAWLWHIPGIFVVVTWLFFFGHLPVWAVIAGTYGAWALLRIRTFLEHRAHDRAAARTVIVEDRGLLALIFLNNNFHAVHHSHPCVPWYRLPALYAARKPEYLRKNGAYSYAGYGEVFRRYFFNAKDPVPHPLWRRR
jgi:fatty acid desaturase